MNDYQDYQSIPNNQLLFGVIIGLCYLIGILAIPFVIILYFIPMSTSLMTILAQLFSIFLTLGIYYSSFRDKILMILKQFFYKKTYKYFIIYFVVNYLILLIYGAIITMLKLPSDSANQESIRQLVSDYPLLAFLFVVILAPIVEELIFRFVLLDYCKRKTPKIDIHIVAFTFMLIHIVSSIVITKQYTGNDSLLYFNISGYLCGIPLSALLSIPSYLIPAYIFTYVAKKYDNIASCILIHSLSNLLSFIFILLNIG